MKRFALAALCGMSFSSALAGPRPNNAVDTDGDGAYVVPDLNRDGAINDDDYFIAGGADDKADFEAIFGALDCDDNATWRHPGATEVFNDGIDQDCDGADFLPPTGFEVKNFTALAQHSCAGGDFHRAAKLVATCDAHAECVWEVDTLGNRTGGIVMTNDHVLADLVVGTTLGSSTDVEFSDKVFRSDGHCEVYTATQYAYAQTHARAAAPPRPTGVSQTMATRIAEKAAADGDAKLREDLEAANEATNVRIDELDQDTVRMVGLLEEDIAANEEAISAEATARAEGDEDARLDRERIDDKAAEALTTADAAASHSALLEVGAVGGVIGREPMAGSNGTTVRGGSLGNGGFELRSGVDADGYQLAAFGQVSVGSDGAGVGADQAYLLGTEFVWDVGVSGQVGPWVGYVHTEDHANPADLSVREDGAIVGLTARVDSIPGSTNAVALVRVGAGPGYHVSKGVNAQGHPLAVSAYGPVAMVQVGVVFGTGAQDD